MEDTSEQIFALNDFSIILLIILLAAVFSIAFIQKDIIENFQKEAITRGYAEKVIEKNTEIFKWK